MSKDTKVDLYDTIDTDLMIDIKNVSGELMDQALLMRKWTRAKASANKTAKLLKLQVAQAKGNLHKQLVAKGFRVGDIEAAKDTDPAIIKLSEQLAEAEAEAEALEGIVRAFYFKSESLKELSFNLRKGVE